MDFGLNVEVIKEPRPDEVILLKFRWGDVPIDELESAYKNLGNKFPNNKIIALDENIEFYITDKQDVLEILWNMIQRLN